jgi:hypothetical protein
MLEYISTILPIVVNWTIGLVVFLLYQQTRKSALELLSIAFFLNSIPDVVHLALGGPYFALRLMEQGFTVAEVGMVSWYLFLVRVAFKVLFVVLVLVGVFKLARKDQTVSHEYAEKR